MNKDNVSNVAESLVWCCGVWCAIMFHWKNDYTMKGKLILLHFMNIIYKKKHCCCWCECELWICWGSAIFCRLAATAVVNILIRETSHISLSLLVVIIKVITFFIMFNAIYLVRIIAWELISGFFYSRLMSYWMEHFVFFKVYMLHCCAITRKAHMTSFFFKNCTYAYAI